MSSLSQSRWAPASAGDQKNSDRNSNAPFSPSEELSRFRKIAARLRWKLPFLDAGYQRATATATPDDPMGMDADEIAQAEIMFKLDFHEYYALLERALVHLLAVFGVTVSARNNTPWSTSHRYHANVLDALQVKSSPLHTVLGSGNTFDQLKRAKELRNRWKTADLSADEKLRDDFYSATRVEKPKPLASYDLAEILKAVLGGIELGYELAEAHVAKHDPSRNGHDRVEDDWAFIVDAMDWEAV
ncbi:hypothetical protein BDW74DRAFT_66564 [Aspergillus multicolor]|uniref:uncharacterized protein n=1 Tax=Aspergillus multicolor TaxID=41759 RepID=UPI003CCDEBF5